MLSTNNVAGAALLALAPGVPSSPAKKSSKVRRCSPGAHASTTDLSVVFNAAYLNQTPELGLALKKLALLVAYLPSSW